MHEKYLHRFNALAAASLAVLHAVWWYWSESQGIDAVPAFSILAVFPNAILAPWLWRGSRSAATIAGFLATFFFAHAVMELFANPAVRGWVAIETFLAASLFLGAMLALRGGAPAGRPARHDTERKGNSGA